MSSQSIVEAARALQPLISEYRREGERPTRTGSSSCRG